LKGEEVKGDHINLKRGTTQAAYLKARLRRDAPEAANRSGFTGGSGSGYWRPWRRPPISTGKGGSRYDQYLEIGRGKGDQPYVVSLKYGCTAIPSFFVATGTLPTICGPLDKLLKVYYSKRTKLGPKSSIFGNKAKS